MEVLPEISIPRTINKNSESLFGNKYTVTPNQLYEIHLKVRKQSQAIVQKRYREIRSLYDTLLPLITSEMSLPKFPEKTLFKMNNDIIDKRRSEIENFLNLAIKNEILAEHIFVFMGISFKANVSLTKNSNTADKVLKFIGKINSTANNKMRLIEKFEFSFFSKRHSLSSEFIYKLLQSLIPLCGDDFIGSKALDVISKLTTSDYYRDFAIASKELCRFAPEYLQTMKLHEYLTKRRFGDSQIQAYTICKMLENSLGIQILFEIINNDGEAMEVFSSWGNEKSAEKPVVAVRSSVQDWRPLLKEKDLCLEFRFIGRELEINAFLHVRSTIPRVIDILTVPSERKKWDIRMQEMLNIPLNGGFIFIYANERKLYEFHSLVKILQSQTQGTVEFNTLCYEFKRQNTVFGKFTSVYNASVIEETEEENKGLEEFDPQGNKFHKLKVTWNSHFCEASFELIRGDIFQEADILRKSFQLMINLAEFRDQETAEGIQNENNLLETFERKKLTKTFSLGNFDFT